MSSPAGASLVSAWRAYAGKGGRADLQRFSRVWTTTAGLRRGRLGRLVGVAGAADAAPAGEPWPAILELACTATSVRLERPATGMVRYTDPPAASSEASSTRSFRLRLDLIEGVVRRNDRTAEVPLDRLDADEISGGSWTSNLEWNDRTSLRWNRVRGAFNYGFKRLHRIAGQTDVEVTEQGTCDRAP